MLSVKEQHKKSAKHFGNLFNNIPVFRQFVFIEIEFIATKKKMVTTDDMWTLEGPFGNKTF